MQEIAPYLLIGIIGMVINIFILIYVIKTAVKSAMTDHEFYQRAIYRMQIKKLLKEGMSRHDIVDLVQDDNDTFWGKIQ